MPSSRSVRRALSTAVIARVASVANEAITRYRLISNCLPYLDASWRYRKISKHAYYNEIILQQKLVGVARCLGVAYISFLVQLDTMIKGLHTVRVRIERAVY